MNTGKWYLEHMASTLRTLGASMAWSSKAMIRMAQILCAIEVATILIVALSAWLETPSKDLSAPHRVLLALEIITGASLLFLIIAKRSWAFMIVAVLNAFGFIVIFVRMFAQQQSSVGVLICWGVMVAIPLWTWHQLHRASISLNRERS